MWVCYHEMLGRLELEDEEIRYRGVVICEACVRQSGEQCAASRMFDPRHLGAEKRNSPSFRRSVRAFDGFALARSTYRVCPIALFTGVSIAEAKAPSRAP